MLSSSSSPRLVNAFQFRPSARMRSRASQLTRMQLDVRRWNAQERGPVTREKVLRQLQDEGYSTSTYVFPPGTVFDDHSHGCEKKDSIISGRFRFRMGNEEVVLEGGDTLVVPRGKVHSAEVVGSSPCEFVDASKY